jgi:hypothetical protein
VQDASGLGHQPGQELIRGADVADQAYGFPDEDVRDVEILRGDSFAEAFHRLGQV